MEIPVSYPKKIVLCLHHFLPEFIAGTEIYTFNLAKHLIKAGIDTLVLIPNLGINKTEEYVHEGVRVVKYGENSIEDRAMIKGLKKPDGLAEFGNILTIEKPDIVHFHELAPGRGISIFHVERAYELKFRIFLTFHLSTYTCLKGTLIYKDDEKCDGKIQVGRCSACLYHSKNITGIAGKTIAKAASALHGLHVNTYRLDNRFGTALGFPFMVEKLKADLISLYSFSEKIIVLTSWYKRVLMENSVPDEKIVCITQGLAHSKIKMSRTAHLTELPLKIIFIGRINKLKGVDLLIEAVQAIPEDKVVLTIYGPETDIEFSKFYKEKTKKSKNIYWKGILPASEVVDILTVHDILCLPSTFSEMSPLVIQEAFAAGIPVLASDVYGNAEQIIDGETGWLFNFKDSGDLNKKINLLIDDLSAIKKAKNKVPIPNYFNTIVDQHIDLYSKITSDSKIN